MKRTLIAALICLLVAAPALASSWEAQAAKVKRSVQRMSIVVEDLFGNEETGTCTAFSINDLRDYFLTAAHCFGKKMTIGGHEARLVYLDDSSDLMVLMVPESGEVPAIKMAKLRDCQDGTRDYVCQGEEIGAMGYGLALAGPQFRPGWVAVTSMTISDWFGPSEYMLLNAFSYVPGMSGGPVFNHDGRLVGIVQWGDNRNYFGGGRTLAEILEKIGQYLK
jgi:S1-C subfamily serine protease